MSMLSKNVVAKLKELDSAQQRLNSALNSNTKACLFEQKEEMLDEYYARRSGILMKIQTDQPEKDILDYLQVAINATMVKVELWEKTMVKR